MAGNENKIHVAGRITATKQPQQKEYGFNWPVCSSGETKLVGKKWSGRMAGPVRTSVSKPVRRPWPSCPCLSRCRRNILATAGSAFPDGRACVDRMERGQIDGSFACAFRNIDCALGGTDADGSGAPAPISLPALGSCFDSAGWLDATTRMRSTRCPSRKDLVFRRSGSLR
jgi:hypothetical protein